MKYKRLTGSKRGLGKWYGLWLGDDHLLAVESTGYSEEYTRFYLKDIKAIITQHTFRGKILNAICGTIVLIAVLCAALSYRSDRTLSPVIFLTGILGGFFLLLMLWNLFRGPTCRCYIRVPLGIEELAAIDRLRNYQKVLDRIRPGIGELQGNITRNEIIAFARGAKGGSAAMPLAVQPTKRPAHAAPPHLVASTSSYRSGLHRATFLVLIACGALPGVQLLHNSRMLVVCVIALGILFLALAVLAMIRQNKSPIPALAGKMVWGGVATIWLGSVLGYFFAIFQSISKIKHDIYAQYRIIELLASINPTENHPYAFFLVIIVVMAACIGTVGLVSLERGDDGVRRRAS